MKATGVVRRIDDLGRIVIPKEIRRNLKINEGDSVEIFVDNNSIILKKYSLFDDIIKLADNLVDTFYKLYGKNIIVTDKEKVIATNKNLRKEYLGKEITDTLKGMIENRSEVCNNNVIELISNGVAINSCFIVPVIANSDSLGSIILITDNIDEDEKRLIHFMNSILVKNIEE